MPHIFVQDRSKVTVNEPTCWVTSNPVPSEGSGRVKQFIDGHPGHRQVERQPLHVVAELLATDRFILGRAAVATVHVSAMVDQDGLLQSSPEALKEVEGSRLDNHHAPR